MDTKLKKLQEKWYKKLKESGFNDIELPGNRLDGRIRPDKPNAKVFDQTRDYFYNASQVELPATASSRQRHIWQKHVEGKFGTEIAKDLRISHISVSKYIKEVQTQFKLKRFKKDKT